MKPGRNDPCPCGSGKKYKKCCYLTEQNTVVKKFMESQDIQNIQDDNDDDFYDDIDDDFYDDDDDNDFYDDDNDDYYDNQELLITAMNNLRRFFLDKKPHIKKYYKIRNMHSEIVNTMIQYYYDGKFKQQPDTNFVSEPIPVIHLLESDFDLDTRTGSQGKYAQRNCKLNDSILSRW